LIPCQRSNMFKPLMQITITPVSPIPNPQARPRAVSIWQAGYSLLGSAVLLILALHFTWRGLSWISNPQIARDEITGSFLLAASLALGGMLLLPSAGYALAQLAGRPVESIAGRGRLSPWITLVLLGAAFFFLLVIGALVSESTPLAWIVLPFVHILVIVIPVAAVLYLGGRGLPKGSPQRAWGIFATGMTLGPVLTFALEIVALFACVIAGMLLIALTPGQLSEFTRLAEQLQTINQSPEAFLQVFQPYSKNPIVVGGVLLFMAGIVPLLEEAIKPIGVWLLARRRLTPAEGFTAGLISGAGFALVESLGYANTGGQGWLTSVLLRAPTAFMHIFTCGLTGWGFARATSLHRSRWLLAGYGGAVAIHGLWNGLTITAAGIVWLYPDQTGAVAVAGLALLGLLADFGSVFLLLILINLRLRRQTAHAIIHPQSVLGLAPDTTSPDPESSLHEYHP
jgi:RsiW-degrading membrane proteinase PrsW (M82 family)